MSGLATAKNGKGTGDIIRGLKPRLVIEPWTEGPKAKRDATQPTAEPKDNFQLVESLRAQRVIVNNVLDEAELLGRASPVPREAGALRAVAAEGMEGVFNLSAVKNLQTMCPDENHRYVFHGSANGLGAILPGVKVTTLGPPTLKQSEAIRKETASDQNEFWMLQTRTRSSGPCRRKTGSSSPLPAHRKADRDVHGCLRQRTSCAISLRARAGLCPELVPRERRNFWASSASSTRR
jgi:hypothetical protein